MNKIKVGGIVYDVELKEIVEIDQNKNYYGSCDYKSAKIEIANTINEQRQEQTLIHEVMHAVFDEAGISLENEEDIVNRLSLVWYQVLKDNDFSWMSEKGYKEIKTKKRNG